jgi:hypothetical protein
MNKDNFNTNKDFQNKTHQKLGLAKLKSNAIGEGTGVQDHYQHRNSKVQVRTVKKSFSRCIYCNQFIAFERFEKVAFENAGHDSFLPLTRTHVIKSWCVAWNANLETGERTTQQHNCARSRR